MIRDDSHHFEKFYHAEHERVARVVKIAGVKPE